MIATAPQTKRTSPPLSGGRCFSVRVAVPPASARVEADVADCAAGAASPNWDGYGADPLPAEVGRRARMLARALPPSLPAPEVAPAPSGSIDLEWRADCDNCLSLCVYESGPVQYDGKVGGIPVVGSFPLSARVPPAVESLLRQVAG